MNKQQSAFMAKKKEQEYNEQLAQVRELEVKARFWKAQYDIRHYTLAAEDLQKPYDEYVEAQRAKNQKAMEDYQNMLKEISEKESSKKMVDHVVTEEDLIINPEMKENGVQVGDVIQFPEESDLTPEEEKEAIAEFEQEYPHLIVNN